MSQKKVLILVMALILTIAMVGCQGTPAATGEQTQAPASAATTDSSVQYMNLAVNCPLTGSSADWGEAASTAAVYFADYINSKGGFEVNGVKTLIKADVTDCTSDATQAPTILAGILSSGNYSAILGNCTSPLAIADIPIAEQYKVPLFWNGTSNKIKDSGYEYSFRVTPGGPEFTAAQVGLLKQMRESAGLSLTKIGVLYENTSWGVSQSGDSKKNIDAAGGFELVVFESYEPNLTDATALITKCQSAGAQIVFVMAQPADCKQILNTMQTMKYDPLVVGGGGSFLFKSLAEELGDRVEGVITVAGTNWNNAFLNGNPELVSLVKGYADKNGTFLNDHGVQTIVEMACVIEAAQKCGSLAGSDIDAVLHSESFSNEYTKMIQPGGEIKFDKNGDSTPYAIMVQWQNGAPVCIYPNDAASGTLIIPEQVK